jgi:lysophospholipase L1-like esterase
MRFVLSVVLLGCGLVSAAEPVKIRSPIPYQVCQRFDFDPKRPSQTPGGHADLYVSFERPPGATWEYRTVLLDKAVGTATDWTRFANNVRIEAGGWYRLEIRGKTGDAITHAGSVEPIGVGEVFIVAGQSYATNCNDEKLKPADPRVVAYDTIKHSWAIANDPQPVVDKSDGGSIWPPLGDALAKELRVPIGFANVAFGGTSSQQWLPGRGLHSQLVRAGQQIGGFRAVLWQQGESDVIAKTTTEKYVENVRAIRSAASRKWVNAPTWLLAKSTLHPTVYTDPDGEGRIRKGIDELAKLPGFKAGPDTDTLAGENRGDAKSRRHFSAVGQKRAAAMWFDVIKAHLAEPPGLLDRLGELSLLEPAWASPVVRRESSVLLKSGTGPATARLAFPAAELIEVSSADRQHAFPNAKLSADGLTIEFPNPGSIAPIAVADLFPPKDSPNSYKHRLGHPEQNLLYRPGRWFHDRNVEITYRRRDLPKDKLDVHGSLPKTLAKLKAGHPLTIGVSGDSISTGLDASGTTKTFPHQPGYPDLVAAQLGVQFETPIKLVNRAVGGWSVAHGVADLDKLLAAKPDLVIVAYGMNDVGRKDPDWFSKQTKTIVDRIRMANPEIEVILVSPMLGNKEWVHTPREMFAKYRDELRKLTGPGVALADVTAVWELMLKNKHDLDLTGNGLNHPNDFGHRLYAQAILSILNL